MRKNTNDLLQKKKKFIEKGSKIKNNLSLILLLIESFQFCNELTHAYKKKDRVKIDLYTLNEIMKF